MAVSKDYCEYVLEQLSDLGEIRYRRMFGGVGIYCGELFFAIIDNDTLYLKVDDSNRGDFQALQMPPFRPYRDRPDTSLGYYQVPAEVLEDSRKLVRWSRRSLKVAAKKKARRRKR